MTTRDKNNDAAVDAYIAARARTKHVLVRIGEALDDHQDSQPPEGIRWGHVGDLNHVIELLAEIERFLKGNG